MTEKQKTLASGVKLTGKGLHSGTEVEVTIQPAEVNFGYKFKRTDLDNHPVIDALASNVVNTARGTTLEDKGAQVMTVEHLCAALYGMDIDNALIELTGPEIPILDGSSKLFVEAIESVGVLEQDADRVYYEIKEKVKYTDNNGVEILIYPDDEFSVDVHIDFNSKVLGNQFASLRKLSDFKEQISSCKTFVFLHELEALAKNNLIKGGDLDNALIIIDKPMSQEELDRLAELFHKPKIQVRPEGILNNTYLSFQNEPARHKLLDIIGDLSLAGTRIKGKIIARKPGHHANTELAKILQKKIKLELSKPTPPPYDQNSEPVFDINEIKKRLPHRSPFLLVDKVTYMDDTVICGIKNVTMNEAFFAGHYPNEPIMPGVLQIESMAQCGGILLLSFVPDPENYVLYFLKIENIKFKHKVVPGDTLNIRMKLSQPVKHGIAYTSGQVFVGETLVVEGDFMAQIAKKTDISN
ncbi:MAG: bifunctional UDP-3-O-[3-hydroxymyristoyl] N-acetylglucosamine deacetylase/3-hydroxyacyl-ACP dehydratase [Bacteroidales bacterium]|nr:bifunctional UDP-3-O-[3-hydroxymyristoyl] N-acetylglucosamine deacetylase/3-hydroxyacyl-ACP dehydratase [Bacteroidales bacterium]MBN2817719.1 bifunctional UDP-3-O-[3-hydroxymyristoyl] N-acetylglucosamine deacetylase/3-hydroxyacyl-ACP dehydratase [Bacteroidales bacterium]